MRGSDGRSGSLFSYVDLEARVPRGHPLRSIRQTANGALSNLSGDFAEMCARLGRPSIASEAVAGIAAVGVLFGPLGAAVDGTAGFRPAVPLVCGAGDR